MSQQALDSVLERAISDAGFRAQLAKDPATALIGYDLTDEERAAFKTGSVHVERLEDRMSKSDLSSVMAAKTSTPLMRPPSKKR